MWMTSEKAWPCQEGKRKTGVRKDGSQGIHFRGPVVLLDCLLDASTGLSRVSCKMKCDKDIFLKMRKRESWSALSYLRQERNKACWALQRLPEAAGEKWKWRQREKPGSSHSPELSRPALYAWMKSSPAPALTEVMIRRQQWKGCLVLPFQKPEEAWDISRPPSTPRPATVSFRGLLIGAPVTLQEQSVWEWL